MLKVGFAPILPTPLVLFVCFHCHVLARIDRTSRSCHRACCAVAKQLHAMFQSAFAIGWESRLQLPRVQHRRHRYFSTACLDHVGIMVRDLDQSRAILRGSGSRSVPERTSPFCAEMATMPMVHFGSFLLYLRRYLWPPPISFGKPCQTRSSCRRLVLRAQWHSRTDAPSVQLVGSTMTVALR